MMAQHRKSEPVAKRKLALNRVSRVGQKVLYNSIRPYEGTEADGRRVTGKGRTGDASGNGHTPRSK